MEIFINSISKIFFSLFKCLFFFLYRETNESDLITNVYNFVVMQISICPSHVLCKKKKVELFPVFFIFIFSLFGYVIILSAFRLFAPLHQRRWNRGIFRDGNLHFISQEKCHKFWQNKSLWHSRKNRTKLQRKYWLKTRIIYLFTQSICNLLNIVYICLSYFV